MFLYLLERGDTLRRIQDYTREDALFKALSNVIKQGWPESKPYLPSEIQVYFPFREELTLQNRVIFKRDRVIILEELERRLHSSHLGIQA